MPKRQKPGEKPDKPGNYEEKGPRGGNVPNARVVEMEPGDNPLPPTSKPGNVWERLPKGRKR